MPANPNNGGNGVGTSPEEIQHEAVAQAGKDPLSILLGSLAVLTTAKPAFSKE